MIPVLEVLAVAVGARLLWVLLSVKADHKGISRESFDKAHCEIMQEFCDRTGLGDYKNLKLDNHPDLACLAFSAITVELLNRRLFGPRKRK